MVSYACLADRAAGEGALKAKQASGGRTEASVSGGNGMTQQIEAVQRMQDYIEQNLAGRSPGGPGLGRAVFRLGMRTGCSGGTQG